MVRFLSQRRPVGDGGFTLIEAVVALTLASIVFTGFAAASIAGMRSVLVGRTAQQATDIGERALEQMRALGYEGAAMVAEDLDVNDPLPIAGCQCYDPLEDSATGGGVEPLAVAANGGVDPHVTVEETNETAYTVRRYVTVPAEATSAEYKRLTVVVSWDLRGQERTRTTSSTLTAKRSGLPLPDFKWTPAGELGACVAPGAEQAFGFRLRNNGARDSWVVTASGGPVGWSFHQDGVDGVPGAYDAQDPPLTDDVVGPVDPTEDVLVWAVGSPSSTGTSTITFTVTSVAQPTFSQAINVGLQVADACTSVPTPTPTATPTGGGPGGPSDPTPTPTEVPPAQPVSCPGTVPIPSYSGHGNATSTSYYLTNGSSNLGSTPASTAPLPISRLTPPTSTTLWPYSNDLAPDVAGRLVRPSGSAAATSVEWQRQFSSVEFGGTGVLRLWAGPASGQVLDPLTVRATVRHLSSTGAVKKTLLNSAPVGPGSWGCAGLSEIGWAIDFDKKYEFSRNDILSVTITTSGTDALLGYDTTALPAQLVLPVRSGG